ncbi:histidine kinase [Planomonospora sphaerica]|uniref:Histidine kinase n=3 Tax=Planomonospora TaxID=1998 RepID=A0A171DQ49_9ACTN|nr:MEDS domain-containing protein [Planomonospora sphaerica]GAT71182.1 histidine kinase [Planomonospora sphaerica]
MTAGALVRQVRDVEPGDHLCLPFSDDAEQREVATAFITGGLARGERVLYFTDRRAPETVHSWLPADDLAAALRSGRLSVRTAEDSYLAVGRFDPDAMVTALKEETERSLRDGCTGLRVSGEMSWALRDVPGAEGLEDYERKVAAVFATGLSSAVCQYDTRLFGPARTRVFTRCHPGVVGMNTLYHDGLVRIVPAYQAGHRTIRVTGTIDQSNAHGLAAALQAAADRHGDVHVDLSELEFIDVAGLRTLTLAAGRLDPARRLRLLHLAPMLRDIMHLVGWDREPQLVLTTEAGRP